MKKFIQTTALILFIGACTKQVATESPEMQSADSSLPSVALQGVQSQRVAGFAEGEYWMLLSDYLFETKQSNQVITVPAGFVTDYASVPELFIKVGAALRGRFNKAAIVHDWLYWSQECTRLQADNIFKLAMKENNVPDVQALILYNIVKEKGKKAWCKNQKMKKDNYIKVVPEEDRNIRGDWLTLQKKLLIKGKKEQIFLKNPPYCSLGGSVEEPFGDNKCDS